MAKKKTYACCYHPRFSSRNHMLVCVQQCVFYHGRFIIWILVTCVFWKWVHMIELSQCWYHHIVFGIQRNMIGSSLQWAQHSECTISFLSNFWRTRFRTSGKEYCMVDKNWAQCSYWASWGMICMHEKNCQYVSHRESQIIWSWWYLHWTSNWFWLKNHNTTRWKVCWVMEDKWRQIYYQRSGLFLRCMIMYSVLSFWYWNQMPWNDWWMYFNRSSWSVTYTIEESWHNWLLSAPAMILQSLIEPISTPSSYRHNMSNSHLQRYYLRWNLFHMKDDCLWGTNHHESFISLPNIMANFQCLLY